MSNCTGISKPSREHEIPVILNRIDGELNELALNIDSLITSIQPIMSNEGEAPIEVLKESKPMAPLAVVLAGYVRGLEESNRRIRNVIARVEL